MKRWRCENIVTREVFYVYAETKVGARGTLPSAYWGITRAGKWNEKRCEVTGNHGLGKVVVDK